MNQRVFRWVLTVGLIVGAACRPSTPSIEDSPAQLRDEATTSTPEATTPPIEAQPLPPSEKPEDVWFPNAWPEDAPAGSLSRQLREQIESELASHYGMANAELRSAGPAGGFVYVVGDIDGEPFYWANGKLYGSEEFRTRFRDTLRSK